MSHTFECNAGTRFHFNSDLSGQITIQSPEGDVEVPAKDLYEFLISRIANLEFINADLAKIMQNFGVIKIEVHNDEVLITRLGR